MGRTLLLFVFIIAAFFKLGAPHHSEQQTSKTQVATTPILLVHQAEKAIPHPADQDPDLSPAGENQPRNLQQYLAGTQVDVFFSSLIKEPKGN